MTWSLSGHHANRKRPNADGVYGRDSYAKAVAVSGNHAYVANYWYGLQVVDITDPQFPFLVGSVEGMAYSYDVAIAGDYAYVAHRGYGLQVLRITDPEHPELLGGAPTVDGGREVAISAGLACLASGASGLAILPLQCEPEAIAGGGRTGARLQVYPNPSVSRVAIRVPGAPGSAGLAIHDLTGRLVRRLAVSVAGGGGEVSWDGRDDAGREVASGIYLARLTAARHVPAARIVLRR